LHGRRSRRPQRPSRQGRPVGGPGWQPGRQRSGAAVRDVRVRYRSSVAHPGSCDLHHAVRLVPTDPRVGAGGDHPSYPRRM
ncbi:uncharacterized protein METZ01_LOCUS317120, partial [marine metagenome]